MLVYVRRDKNLPWGEFQLAAMRVSSNIVKLAVMWVSDKTVKRIDHAQEQYVDPCKLAVE